MIVHKCDYCGQLIEGNLSTDIDIPIISKTKYQGHVLNLHYLHEICGIEDICLSCLVESINKKVEEISREPKVK